MPASIGIAVVLSLAASDPGHEAEILAWRQQRLAALTRPEGWLSLVGLHWLPEGTARIGSAADNDVVLAVGPAELGRIVREGEGLAFSPAKGTAVEIEGARVEVAADGTVTAFLQSDTGGAAASRIGFGGPSFVVIARGGRLGLRVRDPQAPTRTGFSGVDSFPIDGTWRIAARYERYPEPRTIEVVNILGDVEPTPAHGKAVFERDGKTYRLELLDGGAPGRMFIVFGDRTNGRQTYGMARFLYADVSGETIVLDFNKAYNPPCAFTAFATCPMPPEGNRLDFRVEAGELKPRP